MNLRQIIRNQKLQKFDLISLVSEADEEVNYIDKDGKNQTMAIAPALRLQDPKHPAKIAALKLRGNQEGPKKKGAKEKPAVQKRQDTQDPEGKDIDDLFADDETTVDIDDEAREIINKEMESQNLKPHPEDENVFVDEDGDEIFQIDSDGEVIPAGDIDKFKSDEGEPYADYIDDINDRLYGDEDAEPAKDDETKSVAPNPEATEEEIKDTQENIENAGEPGIKEKSLSAVNEAVFEATIPPATTDKEFKKNMKDAGSKSIKPPVSFNNDQRDRFFSKVPAVYAPVIERMLNQTKGKSSITDFMDGVGAGQPSSQAGEIITMAAITMNDDDAAEFFDMLRERVNDPDYPKDAWIDKSWVDSAQQVRNGTVARYNGTYGEGNWEVEKGCWDSKTEVEAMGLSNYTKNKGFSTDTYMRLNVDGESQLDEISLKKNLAVNFLNKNTSALVDFAILGSDDAGLYTELNQLWAEIPQNKRNKKDTYNVAGEELTAREIQAKINDMRSKAFDNLAESNPELAEQIKLADADNAKVKQRALLGDAISDKGNLISMRSAARDFETLKDEEPLNGILSSLVGGGQNRAAIEDFARDAVEVLLDGDKLDGVTFGKDEDGDALDPMVVYKNGKELKTKAEKEAIFGKGNSAADRIQKIAWYATVVGSAKSRSINKQRERIEENITEHTNAVISTINDIPQMREGMLNAIREEFPLKALFEGEEKMALAQYNCDPKVLKEIFSGAESYEEIQDKLEVEEDEKGELSLVYRAEAGGTAVPVAQLEARSDGKGYGNSFKFTLRVHKDFQNSLKEGNRAAYPESGVYEYLINLGNIISETQENTLAHHWKIAEDDYPVDLFIKELNERSLN